VINDFKSSAYVSVFRAPLFDYLKLLLPGLRMHQNHELARPNYKQYNQLSMVLCSLNCYDSCARKAINQST
jgi:hypothetical protein